MDEEQVNLKNSTSSPENGSPKSSHTMVWIIVAAIIILVLIILGIVLLARSEASTTSRVRDIFIIFMALESLVIGVALIILIIQLAILSNMIQNEIKPLLDNTNQTVSNLKGTTQFLSNQLVGPVIKMNTYLAGLKKLLDIFRISKL